MYVYNAAEIHSLQWEDALELTAMAEEEATILQSMTWEQPNQVSI